MIFIAIHILFNTFILFIPLVIFTSTPLSPWHSPFVAWCLAYIIVSALTIIGYTKIASYIVGLFLPGRAMVGREKAKLEPLLSDVIENTNKAYGTNYRLSDFKLKVTDDKVINAFALGYNIITVNRGVFTSFTDDQIRAILAHEMAHLYYRDSVRSIALSFSAFGTIIFSYLYVIFFRIVDFLHTTIPTPESTHTIVRNIILTFHLLIYFPIFYLHLFMSKVFHLIYMQMNRGAEYRADAFAASLGYKSDMITALEVMDSMTVHDNSFLGRLAATHPAALQRIGALEDEKIASKKIGNLFVASPFSKGNTLNIGGNRDVLRLTSVVVIVGIIWCSWGSWQLFKKPVTKSVNSLATVYKKF